MKIFIVFFLFAALAVAQNFKPAPTLPVVIIGSGIAAARCAQVLKANNLPFVILEARSRIGGRLWSHRSLGAAVDLGASWIHGPSPDNPLTSLATQHNAPTYLHSEDSFIRFRNDGSQYSDTEIDANRNVYNTFKKQHNTVAAQNLNNGLADTSIAQLMTQINSTLFNTIDLQWHVTSNLEFSYGAAAELISSQVYESDKKFPGRDVLIPSGYDKILFGVLGANNASILTEHIVSKVDYSLTDRIEVTCTNGKVFKASKVVVTVPIGVLQANDITFVPALPTAKRNAINALGRGSLNKIALLFPSQFWPNSNFFGYDAGVGNLRGRFAYWINTKPFSNANVLMSFAFGKAGEDIESSTDDQVKQSAMTILRKMFGNNIPEPTGFVMTRWFTDPFARCSYSHSKVNTKMTDYTTVGEPVGTGLFFAGEHTTRDYLATVHGAYLSGARAANELIASIPNPVTSEATSVHLRVVFLPLLALIFVIFL